MLAVYYPDARAAVEQYGDALSGKVVVDITNPVNETFDDLVTPPDSSAAQELGVERAGRTLGKGVQHHVRRHTRWGSSVRRASGRVHRRR